MAVIGRIVAAIPPSGRPDVADSFRGGVNLGAPTNSELSFAQLRCPATNVCVLTRSGIADSAAVIRLGVSGDGEPDVAVGLL